MDTDEVQGEEALQRRITRLEARVAMAEDKAELALHLVRHRLTITGTTAPVEPGRPAATKGVRAARPQPTRAYWAHCSCGEWDMRGNDVDQLADLHTRHVDLVLQPALF